MLLAIIALVVVLLCSIVVGRVLTKRLDAAEKAMREFQEWAERLEKGADSLEKEIDCRLIAWATRKE